MRFLEFFAANIRNPHTRRAYARAAAEFLARCADAGVPSIAAVQPVHVATWIEAGTRELAAIRHLFRLAGGRPGGAGQPRSIGARAPARRVVRANPGARSGRSARCSTASTRRPSSVCAIAR
jgi:hypothetical protein